MGHLAAHRGSGPTSEFVLLLPTIVSGFHDRCGPPGANKLVFRSRVAAFLNGYDRTPAVVYTASRSSLRSLESIQRRSVRLGQTLEDQVRHGSADQGEYARRLRRHESKSLARSFRTGGTREEPICRRTTRDLDHAGKNRRPSITR
jgi:hypothetical protein